MLGRDDEYVSGPERAHHAHLDVGERLRAVRCAFWIGINLTLRGEVGRASGWLGRARRLVDREDRDCVEPATRAKTASSRRSGARAMPACRR
jgi:hypothetical protein